MSDTLNALQTANRTSSVLQAIANPAQVNPLAAIQSGISAASNEYDLASKQGSLLVGQALQQATDEHGNLDFAKAQKIAAGMGPSAALAMQGFLKTSSQLRGEQINQAAGMSKLIGQSAMTVLKDPSDAGVNSVFDNLIMQGMPADQMNAERQRVLAMKDPALRQQYAYQHGLTQLDQLHQVIGQTTLQNIGGQLVPATTGQPSPWGPGGVSQGPGALTVTLTPGEATGLDKIDIGNGQTIQVPHESSGALLRANPSWRAIAAPDGSPTSSTTPPPPPANAVVRPSPARPAPAPAPSGGNPNPNPYGGPGLGVLPPAPGQQSSLGDGGVQVASANPSFAPGVGAAAPPSPAVAGNVNAILAGINQARGTPRGGTQEAFNALQSGGVTGDVAPTVAAPASSATAPASARPVPSLGISAPPGKVEAAQETGKQSATMGGALITRGDQAPVQKANLQNMLTDLQKLDSMGPGTEKEIFLNSVMQKLTGYGFSMNRDQVAAGNSFAKLANIAVGQQLAAIGGTDARQSLFMGSNPHLDMSKLGNERIIQMLKGNEDAIQAKARAWTAWSQSRGPDTYQQFQDDFNRHFDPRVFQSQYMEKGGPELAALRASLEKEGAAAVNKFKDDAAYARANRWIQ